MYKTILCTLLTQLIRQQTLSVSTEQTVSTLSQLNFNDVRRTVYV